MILTRSIGIMLAAAAASAPAAAQGFSSNNSVPIRVFLGDPIAPQNVLFNSKTSGEVPFKLFGDYFLGIERGNGDWMEHQITLTFPGFTSSLWLRTWYQAQTLEIYAQLWHVGCNMNDARRIAGVAAYDAPRQVIGAILAARYLITKPDSICPAPVKNQMRDIYFTLSCNFAKKAPYFELPRDAGDIYLEHHPSKGGDVRACTNESDGVVFSDIHDKAILAKQRGDYTAAAALGEELVALSKQPSLREGQGKAKLSDDLLQSELSYYRTLEREQRSQAIPQ